MSTKTGNMRWAILSGVVGTVIALWAVGSARADVASDEPGAILIYPKIFVDTHGVFGPPTDTEIQVTNTSNSFPSPLIERTTSSIADGATSTPLIFVISSALPVTPP